MRETTLPSKLLLVREFRPINGVLRKMPAGILQTVSDSRLWKQICERNVVNFVLGASSLGPLITFDSSKARSPRLPVTRQRSVAMHAIISLVLAIWTLMISQSEPDRLNRCNHISNHSNANHTHSQTMSTSISLTISEEQDTKTSKSFSDIRKINTADCYHLRSTENWKKDDQFDERRHTGLSVGAAQEASFLNLDSNKLKRWRHQNNPLKENPDLRNDSDEESKVDDFYLEVDDKMSKNSYEYPERQAKYIEKWLDTANATSRSRSFDDEPARLNGNVVGIRGFSSESFISDHKQYRADYNKLKREYLKLETDYNQLRSRFAQASDNQSQVCKRKDHDLNTLKVMVMNQEKQLENITTGYKSAKSKVCDKCKKLSPAGSLADDDEFEKIILSRDELASKLAHKEQEYGTLMRQLKQESEQLRSIIKERDNELNDLKKQVKNLSLEPNNRKLLELSSENARLKDADEIDRNEYLALRENYQRLELKLRSLVDDQKYLNNEQNGEFKEVLLELCKLQVYQPKLEMILETEKQIKLHLQSQLSTLHDEKEHLNDQVTTLTRELNEARLQSRSRESCEANRLHRELSTWQDKYNRLLKDHSDLEELQRTTKSKVSRQDVRLQNELKLTREAHQQELESARSDQRQLETKIASLEVDLSRITNQLDRCKTERDRSNKELLMVHQKLEEVSNSRPNESSQIESIRNNLKQSEQVISTLQHELSVSQLNNNDLKAKIELEHNKLEHSKQQYNELKRRFDLQQKAFDDLKEKKDKEVSKLRLDLNLEQYNRQVSLKGIEKELRSSLRELELMKYRFSKRLNVPNDSFTTSITTSTNDSPPGCKRTVKFDDPPPKQPTGFAHRQQTVTTATTQLRSGLSERQQMVNTTKLIPDPLCEDGRGDKCSRQSIQNWS